MKTGRGSSPAAARRVASGSRYRPMPIAVQTTSFAATTAADALIVLGAAMTLLAVAYLAVQYMLALRQTGFLWVLGVVAIAEPFLLTSGDYGLVSFAGVVFALQCAAAAGAVTLALRRRRAPSVAAT